MSRTLKAQVTYGKRDAKENEVKPFKDSDESKAPLKQTVENLQRIMARDAQLMWEMDKELKQLRDKNQRLAARLAKRGVQL